MTKILALLMLIGFEAVGATDIRHNTGAIAVTEVDVLGSQGSSATVKLAANNNRKWLYVKNLHATEAMYLTFSSGVSGNKGVKIAGGAAFEPSVAPVGNLYLITGTSTGVSAAIMVGY
jgi:hypothetical protein